MLSTLKQNKQVVHIVSEVVILSAVVIYFKNRCNTLQKHINLLAERIEEQAGVLYRQQEQIQSLTNYIKKSAMPNVVVTKLSHPLKKNKLKPIIEVEEAPKKKTSPKKKTPPKKKIQPKKKTPPKKKPSTKIENEISDSEIEKELQELEN